jgi:hypothetical protein
MLGHGQYVEGTPQAGAGAAVGKCLTVRPVQVQCLEKGTPQEPAISLRLARPQTRTPGSVDSGGR